VAIDYAHMQQEPIRILAGCVEIRKERKTIISADANDLLDAA